MKWQLFYRTVLFYVDIKLKSVPFGYELRFFCPNGAKGVEDKKRTDN